MKKQLWSLKAIDTTHDDEVLVIAGNQEEANTRWEQIYGDGDYLGKFVKHIDVVDNHNIIIGVEREPTLHGFNTGHTDVNGQPYLVGSTVRYYDSEGATCDDKIIVKDGDKIGLDAREGFTLVSEMAKRFIGLRVVK